MGTKGTGGLYEQARHSTSSNETSTFRMIPVQCKQQAQQQQTREGTRGFFPMLNRDAGSSSGTPSHKTPHVHLLRIIIQNLLTLRLQLAPRQGGSPWATMLLGLWVVLMAVLYVWCRVYFEPTLAEISGRGAHHLPATHAGGSDGSPSPPTSAFPNNIIIKEEEEEEDAWF
mmetsp:Transcript_8499/g.13760  ORF Transcript_8499/g.13760 Transcript_8499/m.13760 type:complete len:171 (+) Transcript_8499:49-561(+)